MELILRYRGCMLGLAIGDALGTTLEFMDPGSFNLVDDLIGGGPFNLHPGEWTDDTSMALCLAESLIEGGFSLKDQLKRYLLWAKEGYLSSNGKCFDIGNTVNQALERFLETGNPYSGPESPDTAGNGSLMRLAPISMYFVNNPRQAVENAGESSKTTHGARECIDACRYFSGLLVGALEGESKETLLMDKYSPNGVAWEKSPLAVSILEIATGSFKRLNPPEIRGTGHVVKSLEAALWAFYHGDNFKEGAILAVNLGNDADTTGAIYGQLAGAYYGEEGIPKSWREKLVKKELITTYAEKLYCKAINTENRFVGNWNDFNFIPKK